jgi:hypothetical protein
MYDRVTEWEKFSDQVRRHIVAYTLLQYGDSAGNEQVDDFTPEDCWTNMQRYYHRRKNNARGNVEQLRDVIKVAHYASFIYGKLLEELEESDVYPDHPDKTEDMPVRCSVPGCGAMMLKLSVSGKKGLFCDRCGYEIIGR